MKLLATKRVLAAALAVAVFVSVGGYTSVSAEGASNYAYHTAAAGFAAPFSVPIVSAPALVAAMHNAAPGQATTVTLGGDIEVISAISLSTSQNITLDTGGHVLDIVVANPGSFAMQVNGASLTITGGGTVNILADAHIALDIWNNGNVVVADDGSRLNLTNSGSAAGERRAVRSLGGNAVIRGDISVTGPGAGLSQGATGIRSRGGNVTLHGSVVVNGSYSVGIWVHEESNNVSVSGTVTATGDYSQTVLIWRRTGDTSLFGNAGPDVITIGGQAYAGDGYPVAQPPAAQAPGTPATPGVGYQDWGGVSGSQTATLPVPAPRAQTPRVPANNGDISLQAAISGNNVAVTIAPDLLSRLVNNAEGGVVTMDFSALTGVETATIPRAVLNRVAREGLALEIMFSTGGVRLDTAALSAMSRPTPVTGRNNITLAMEPAPNGAAFSIASGSQAVETLRGGTATISLPHTAAGSVTASFVRRNGSLFELETTFDQDTQTAVFTTATPGTFVLSSAE